MINPIPGDDAKTLGHVEVAPPRRGNWVRRSWFVGVSFVSVSFVGVSFVGVWSAVVLGVTFFAPVAIAQDVGVADEVEAGGTPSPAIEPATSDSLEIESWYGDHLRFGHLGGHPQRQINLLGAVRSSQPIDSVTYQLDRGPALPLTFETSNPRLVRTGDFNVELDRRDLTDGLHRMKITAVDRDGHSTTKRIMFAMLPESSERWPKVYDIRWSDVARIDDVVQVVDGHWELTKQGIRTVSPGYDRMLAIGDDSWENVEVQTTFWLHGVTPPSSEKNRTGVSHVAIAHRWPGHTRDGRQPSVQWHPLGATAEFRLGNLHQARWRIFDAYCCYVEGRGRRHVKMEHPYRIKHRVQSTTDGTAVYRVKCWDAETAEPVKWDLTRIESKENVPTGSSCLIAHFTDVTFGDVRVLPLPVLERLPAE